MAQDRVLTDVEHRGKNMSLPPELGMAEGVHPAPHDDQPPVPHPVVDAARTQPERQQLPPCDDAMLTGRKLMDRIQTLHRNV